MFVDNLKYFKCFSAEDLATWGILGYFPNRVKALVKEDMSNLFYVAAKQGKSWLLVGTRQPSFKLSLCYYDDYQVGDVLLYYQERYFKIQDVTPEMKAAFPSA